MTENFPTSASSLVFDPDALTVTTETEAYRSAAVPSDTGDFRYFVTKRPDPDSGDPQDPDTREAVADAEAFVEALSEETYPTADEAREAGRGFVFDLIGDDTITVERADGLFGRVCWGAARVGLDPSGWKFGQLAGLSWVIYEISDTGRAQLGLWESLADAYIGMQGMATAFERLAHQREETQHAAEPPTVNDAPPQDSPTE